jgi:putative drug exporter of the RND superfamily
MTASGREDQKSNEQLPMNAITRFVLGHKVFICIAGLVVAVAGGATAGTTTNRLSGDWSIPGQPAFQTDPKIAAPYHSGAGGAASGLLVDVGNSG